MSNRSDSNRQPAAPERGDAKTGSSNIDGPEFVYSAWRHGGWYVDNVRYPCGSVGCVSRNFPDRRWRIISDDRPDAFERFTYRTRDEAAGAERDLIELGILGRRSASEGRKVTLEKLAERHGVSRAEANTAAEDLNGYLEAPASIKRWVAVTFAALDVAYLKADFDDASQARAYVEGLLEDPTFPELPTEVYDLDTGERISARLRIVWGEA